tara:strand:- start:4878 stop:5036 length:159 start_codon:yes stop_codon:yes gene_type:complete
MIYSGENLDDFNFSTQWLNKKPIKVKEAVVCHCGDVESSHSIKQKRICRNGA